MTWPFVSRAAFEAVAHQNSDLWARITDLEERNAALTEHIVSMKKEGFTGPALGEQPPEPPAPLPMIVDELLRDLRLPPGEQVRVEQQARELLQQHEPGDVVRILLDGGMGT